MTFTPNEITAAVALGLTTGAADPKLALLSGLCWFGAVRLRRSSFIQHYTERTVPLLSGGPVAKLLAALPVEEDRPVKTLPLPKKELPEPTPQIERNDSGKVNNQRLVIREATERLPALVGLNELNPHKSPTAFPLGIDQDGNELWFDLSPTKPNHTNFISVTGQPNAGKDTLFKAWFQTLATRNSPEKVRFVFVDGKGPWYAPSLRKHPSMMFPFEKWDGEAKTAMLSQMQQLQQEMKRRYHLIVEENECEDLEEYTEETGKTLPYIVLVVTDVLGDLNGQVEKLLEQIVAKGRACGIRAWVSLQTTVGESSKWRSLMTAYISGPVQGAQSDAVVMGTEGGYLAYRPSLMDTALKGVFCVRYGQREWLVKAPWVGKSEFKNWYRGPNTNSAANLLTELLLPQPNPPAVVRSASVSEGGENVGENPFTENGEGNLTATEAVTIWKGLSGEDRQKTVKALSVFTKTGKITVAIREVWGVTGGKSYQKFGKQIEAAKILKALTSKNPNPSGSSSVPVLPPSNRS